MDADFVGDTGVWKHKQEPCQQDENQKPCRKEMPSLMAPPELMGPG